jgi:hypothetical protein
MTRSYLAPHVAQTAFECACCDRVWQLDADRRVHVPSDEEVEILRALTGMPGHPRTRWIPAELDDDLQAPARHQLPSAAEREAVDRDSGCRVPGCPNAHDGRPSSLRAVAAAVLASNLELDPDDENTPTAVAQQLALEDVSADDLVTLCPTHARAALRRQIAMMRRAAPASTSPPSRPE